MGSVLSLTKRWIPMKRKWIVVVIIAEIKKMQRHKNNIGLEIEITTVEEIKWERRIWSFALTTKLARFYELTRRSSYCSSPPANSENWPDWVWWRCREVGQGGHGGSRWCGFWWKPRSRTKSLIQIQTIIRRTKHLRILRSISDYQTGRGVIK